MFSLDKEEDAIYPRVFFIILHIHIIRKKA